MQKYWVKISLIVFVYSIGCSLLLSSSSTSVRAMSRSGNSSTPRMGPHLDIWTDGVDNLGPAVAYNNLHDEYLVVWYTKQDDFTWDIWARQVGKNGELKNWFNVDSISAVKLTEPKVAYNPLHDEYLIVYTKEVTPNVNLDIIAKRIAWNAPGNNPVIIVDNSPGIQVTPNVAYNSLNDEYLVVYENHIGTSTVEIHAGRIKGSDGAFISHKLIATGTNQFRHDPDVAFNSARNNYLITYSFESMAPGYIHAKVASADLSGLSPEFEISGSTNHEYRSVVAAGPDEFLVAWIQMDASSFEERVYGRRVNYDGTPLGPFQGFPIGTSTTTKIIRHVFDVAYSPVTGYLVTSAYIDPFTTDEFDVYGRYSLPGQDHATGEEFPIDNSPHYQLAPSLACAPYGDCLVAEMHNPLAYPAGDKEIRGRIVYGRRIYLPAILRTFH